MKKTIIVMAGMFALSGCATGGGGSGGGGSEGAHPIAFSHPAEISQTEFKKNPDKYAKEWLNVVDDGMDEYKKITIPVYTVDFQTLMSKANQNKFSTAFVNEDGAANILNLAVVFPWEENRSLLQDITDTSYARLVEKFKKIGLEVVDWSSVKAKYEDAREFEKEKLNMEPVKKDGHMTSFAANGLGRIDSIFFSGPAINLSREAEVGLVMARFGVGFGYFDGQETPFTIKEHHGSTGVTFTPQAQVYTGSGIITAAKYYGGRAMLDKTAVSNRAFSKGLSKWGDSRADADTLAQVAKGGVAGVTGTTNDQVKVSTRASVGYDLKVDAAKFKEAVLAELDKAEDLIVHRYKMELN